MGSHLTDAGATTALRYSLTAWSSRRQWVRRAAKDGASFMSSSDLDLSPCKPLHTSVLVTGWFATANLSCVRHTCPPGHTCLL